MLSAGSTGLQENFPVRYCTGTSAMFHDIRVRYPFMDLSSTAWDPLYITGRKKALRFIITRVIYNGSLGCHRASIITLRAKLSGAVYCYRSCLWACLQRAGGRAGGVCYHDNSKLRIHQTRSVGAGSDHLQLITFWQSCAPGKGICVGVKKFGSVLLYGQRAVFASLRALFSFSLQRTAF